MNKTNDISPTSDSALASKEWLAKKYFDELSLQFRTVWDIYIKWYTVFLTTNVVAIGAVVQYVIPENRGVLVFAFAAQNALGLMTALFIGRFSRTTAKRMVLIAALIVADPNESSDSILPVQLRASPLPGNLGFWSGIANAIGNVTLMACWIALLFI
jgi:hypothetical protein